MPDPAPIYLDYHATTPIDPRVREAMAPYLQDKFGNASSASHRYGWIAEEAVEKAREQVARLINATPGEIIFTSGATESNNLAILGLARALGMTRAEQRWLDVLAQDPTDAPPKYAGLDWAELRSRGARAVFAARRDHLVTAGSEHKAVLDTMRHLEADGFRLSLVPVDGDGLVGPDALESVLDDRTLLVSIMLANNEIGVIQPLQELARRAHARGAIVHTDAVQAVGRIPVDLQALGVDLLSLTGHKMYGPKGVGALFVRRKNPRVVLEPLVHGGGQEKGLRSGTYNVAGIVGLGAAAELAQVLLAEEQARTRALRDRLWTGLRGRIPGLVLNGHPTERLPGNLHLAFPDVEGEPLMNALRELAISSGSACSSAERKPSHVLRALGYEDARAHRSLRFGVGRFTTEAEVDRAIDAVVDRVSRLRSATQAPEVGAGRASAAGLQ